MSNAEYLLADADVNTTSDAGSEYQDKVEKLDLIPYLGIPEDIAPLSLQFSNPMFSVLESNYSLIELKLLFIYLSRIDSRNPAKCRVLFSIKDLQRVFGVSRIKEEPLRKRLFHTDSSVIIKDPEIPKGYSIIHLFSKIDVEEDDNGVKNIIMIGSPESAKYIFDSLIDIVIHRNYI